ncbi:hypothetical protein CVT24_004774 [Panaeolus cyanescens]|uniref:Protein-lysine N-methyltransferase EFM5 n=1 Tax=Panaeolus cyanescens TaxID=181874 RepID=A0A409V9U2_9AGAR|nr:hypothetical protein CVT24_004774 [Panaeolus cyanescens]
MTQDQLPESPRSVLTDLSGSPPKLDPDTMALLDSFFKEKAEEERRFAEIAAERAALAAARADEMKPIISPEEFRLAFGEQWQLSQFWYSDAFAERLASALNGLCEPSTKIAFLCCPTAFVGFQHFHPHANAMLMEYDERFAVLSPQQFVHYDLNEPDVFPEDLRESFDIIVADPPYLNEKTNVKLKTTVDQIIKPATGKLVMITSTIVEKIIQNLYGESPIGHLKRTAIEVEHANQLGNDFAVWGSWDGAEDFGKQ